jgi:hypothetical protein
MLTRPCIVTVPVGNCTTGIASIADSSIASLPTDDASEPNEKTATSAIANSIVVVALNILVMFFTSAVATPVEYSRKHGSAGLFL